MSVTYYPKQMGRLCVRMYTTQSHFSTIPVGQRLFLRS